MISIHELKEVIETLRDKDFLAEKQISFYEFLDIFDVVNKNLKEKFQDRIPKKW